MKTFEYVAVAALALIALGYVNSQGDEPTLDTCNFSRLDVSDCIIDRPTANQYSIFATRLVSGQSGTLQCRVFRRRTVTRDVVNLDQPQLRIVFSPGFLLDPPELYRNQQLVVYNVQCAPNEFAFFRLLELETEDHNCPNLNTGALRCQDYFSVTDDGSGIIESCGTDPGNNDMRLLDHNFTVAFRTSDRRCAAGFRGYAVCYEPELTDSEGCTEAPGDEVNNTETRRRRKRNLEHFHNHWRWRMYRMKRQGVEFRIERLQILNGDIVRYQNEQLFIDRTDPDASAVFDNVAFLHTFNVNGPEIFFKTTDLPFIGPGPLVILGEYAYFQLFAIDPRGVIPTQAEAVLIGNLTDAQFDLVNASMDVRGRRKRQISSDDFSDETVIIAIQNERACNPVLRAQANGILSLVDSGRIDMLRAELEATTPPAPVTTPPVMTSTTPVEARARARARCCIPHRFQQISSDDFSDETVIIAIQNERTCNPVLRAQANGILSLVDSGRIDMLRAELEATTPPAPVTTPPVMTSTTPVEARARARARCCIPHRFQQISSDDFSDDTVIIAIQNERACNPVLRAQANGVLSLVDSGRIAMLRAELEATTPPAPVTTPPVTDSTTPVTSTTPVEELTGTTTDDMSSTTPPGDGGTGFSL